MGNTHGKEGEEEGETGDKRRESEKRAVRRETVESGSLHWL